MSDTPPPKTLPQLPPLPGDVQDSDLLYAVRGNKDYRVTGDKISPPSAATQSEAEAGTEAALRSWSPERVKQAISSLQVPPPLPYAAHSLGMTPGEWRKAAKFTYTKTTAVTGSISVDNGATHIKLLRWDGTWSAVKAVSGLASIVAGDWGDAPAAPYNSRVPKFGAIVPCNSSGNVTGDLTLLSLDNNQITTFDGTGLGELGELSLDNNQITTFYGTGLGALVVLFLNNNQITIFDGTGLGALVELSLDNNQLTTFYGTGLGALVLLFLNNNQLTTFYGTGLGSLVVLFLNNNQLDSVLLPDFKGEHTWTTYALDLSNQNMTTDAVYLMLDSISTPAIDQPYPINLMNNPCDAGAGPALVEDGTHTQSEVEALLTAKGYSLQLIGGTIAP